MSKYVVLRFEHDGAAENAAKAIEHYEMITVTNPIASDEDTYRTNYVCSVVSISTDVPTCGQKNIIR
jgi:hypothetical protein